MPTYKLTYFNGRAHGELTRLLFAAGGIEYEDVRLEMEEWAELQSTGKINSPMGQLPLLEVEGTVLCQSNSIARYVARLTGLAGKSDLEQAKVDMVMEGTNDMMHTADDCLMYEKDPTRKAEKTKAFVEKIAPKYYADLSKLVGDKGYFVGDQLTAADIIFFSNTDTIGGLITLPSLDKFPKLKKVVENVKNNPGIAKWLKERPETPW